MLRSLRVKNLALIRETEVETAAGLNILTGETGAGKSLLMGSVGLAMGERANRELFGDAKEDVLIELTFDAIPPAAARLLEEHAVSAEDELILTRKITAGGRNVCRVNAETVSVSFLKELTAHLIQIHGQREHEVLRDKRRHLTFLDAFCKKELGEKPKQTEAAYHRYMEAVRTLREAGTDEEERIRELHFLAFEVGEIEDAHLVPGEEEELEAQFRMMSHAQKIIGALSACLELTGGNQTSAAEQTGRAIREIREIITYDERLSVLYDQLSEIEALLSDFNQDCSAHLSEMEFGEDVFYEVENRLNTIHRLQSKYGNSIEEILAEKEKKQERIEQLENFGAYLEKLEQDVSDAKKELDHLCGEMTKIRKKAATQFSAVMEQSLRELNFSQVVFQTEITETEGYTSAGTDEVRFLISTNPGEEVRPLDLVASGGELSRIMLAFRTILADSDEVQTLIFDEIDSGISGRTAQKVAEKMRETARCHQVICITHLPQIAAMADQHFLIEKTIKEDKTQTEVTTLSYEQEIHELARMLGGAKITDAALKNAVEMKEMAKESDE
ncbi:MAG: DNA repair protein RecN [Lachnospiraceae bacterium]|nr:DNA repair protein RecN [Lachnospiraceae bacterium]